MSILNETKVKYRFDNSPYIPRMYTCPKQRHRLALALLRSLDSQKKNIGLQSVQKTLDPSKKNVDSSATGGQ